MQGSRLPPCAFSRLAYRFPTPFQRLPHWSPILGSGFHDYFLGLLLKQPCRQRSQLFGATAELPSLKVELAIDFDIRHNDSEHPLVDINSRYPIGHSSSWPKQRACCGYLKQGRGLSPLPQGRTTTPNYSLKQARSGSDSDTASTSPVSSRPRRFGRCDHSVKYIFMRFRGPVGPKRTATSLLRGYHTTLYPLDRALRSALPLLARSAGTAAHPRVSSPALHRAQTDSRFGDQPSLRSALPLHPDPQEALEHCRHSLSQ